MLCGLILTTTLAAQCGPLSCPAPVAIRPGEVLIGPVVDVPTGGVQLRSWKWARNPDGTSRRVWGWEDRGRIWFYESEQPPSAEPGPAPVLPSPQKEKGKEPLNFGVDISKLNRESRVIRASDPATLERVQGELKAAQASKGEENPNPPPKIDSDEEEKKPLNPIRRVEGDISFAVYSIVAALLVLGGLILITRGQRS